MDHVIHYVARKQENFISCNDHLDMFVLLWQGQFTIIMQYHHDNTCIYTYIYSKKVQLIVTTETQKTQNAIYNYIYF